MSASFVFFLLALACMAAVLLSLIGGIVFMTRSGDSDRVRSNKMMQARVYLQGFAIIFLLLSALAK